MIKKSRYYVLVYILLVFTIIIFSWTDNGGLYFPLVYFMYISPILFLFLCPVTLRKDELYLWALIPLLFMPLIVNWGSFRFSTVIYGCLFIFVFLFYRTLLLLKSISILQYRKILLFILYAYFIVLLAQQIGVLLGLPVINKNWTSDTFKLNSLAYEASYVATLLPLLMYSIVKTDEVLLQRGFGFIFHIKNNPMLWFAFLYTIFTCGATTIFFTFPVFFLYFFKQKISINSIVVAGLVGIFGIFLINNFNPTLLERYIKLVPAILSFDSIRIIEIDPSASTRIVPFILICEKIIDLDGHLLMGHGIDYSQKLYGLFLANDADRHVGSVGLVGFILDYGLIAGVVFLVSVVKLTSKKIFSYENLLFFTCFSIFGFNHYMTWAYLIFMTTNRYFSSYTQLNMNSVFSKTKLGSVANMQ